MCVPMLAYMYVLLFASCMYEHTCICTYIHTYSPRCVHVGCLNACSHAVGARMLLGLSTTSSCQCPRCLSCSMYLRRYYILMHTTHTLHPAHLFPVMPVRMRQAGSNSRLYCTPKQKSAIPRDIRAYESNDVTFSRDIRLSDAHTPNTHTGMLLHA